MVESKWNETRVAIRFAIRSAIARGIAKRPPWIIGL
jgi:hypothetical protein